MDGASYNGESSGMAPAMENCWQGYRQGSL